MVPNQIKTFRLFRLLSRNALYRFVAHNPLGPLFYAHTFSVVLCYVSFFTVMGYCIIVLFVVEITFFSLLSVLMFNHLCYFIFPGLYQEHFYQLNNSPLPFFFFSCSPDTMQRATLSSSIASSPISPCLLPSLLLLITLSVSNSCKNLQLDDPLFLSPMSYSYGSAFPLCSDNSRFGKVRSLTCFFRQRAGFSLLDISLPRVLLTRFCSVLARLNMSLWILLETWLKLYMRQESSKITIEWRKLGCELRACNN